MGKHKHQTDTDEHPVGTDESQVGAEEFSSGGQTVVHPRSWVGMLARFCNLGGGHRSRQKSGGDR